jgi:hypothetical protein
MTKEEYIQYRKTSICNICKNLKSITMTVDTLGWDDSVREYIPVQGDKVINMKICLYTYRDLQGPNDIVKKCTKFDIKGEMK